MEKILDRISAVIIGLLLFLTSFIGFGALWGLTTWGDLDVDEIIFQLQAPLEGTGNGMILDYMIKGLLPAVIIALIYIICIVKIRKQKARRLFMGGAIILTVLSLFCIKNYIWKHLNVDEWLKGRGEKSLFIQENYVDPNDVTILFPPKKRNLIYIFLESVEMTYTDPASGGAFPENCIPELTQLGYENEDFSGEDGQLNGGIVLPGTGFTTGAMFGQSAGLPLRVSIGANNMHTQSSFFPKIKTMGDILDEEGYRQVLMIGSDATFGGRRLFYEQHGNFEIFDHPYAQQTGLISADYKVFWGYEDEKLFAFAKDKLAELSAGSHPFNLTLLTVDTHFEDGYVCRLCGSEFGDNQYANVMACSSRQVTDFVRWIQEQPFYENTTVVVCGDHKTMDTDFCADVDGSYQRKTYTAFINPAVSPELSEKRTYSTMDMFPTTLASLGASIENNRLGLGTNLFSELPTLTEEFGYEFEVSELNKKSLFLESMEKIDKHTDALLEKYRSDLAKSLKVEYLPGQKKISVTFTNRLTSGVRIAHCEAVCTEDSTGSSVTVELVQDPDNSLLFMSEIDLADWNELHGSIEINMTLFNGETYENVVSGTIDHDE